MLRDEPIEYIEEQFLEKNEVLNAYGEQVTAATFYEDIFGDVSLELPVVFLDDEAEKHIVPMTVEEALEQNRGRNDVLMGGSSYFNNWIGKRSAKDVYSFIVDMDNVYSGTLQRAFMNNWNTENGEYLPMPTYIVNSGTGLHLYFVLTEPIPHYKTSAEDIDKLYRSLALQQTTKRVYLEKQVQWFGQDFRMAGGLNKYGWENTVFKVGEKWDIDELGRAVGLEDTHFVRYGEKKTFKPKTKVRRSKNSGWKTNRAFYDAALRECRDKTKEGNRYTSMCALSVIAWKCDVHKDELEQDLIDLLPTYNKGAKRKVKQKEIYSAMKMYNPKAMLTQRERLEDWQGWKYNPIKRNGRTQAQHMEVMRAIQNIVNPDWRNKEGRPKGSGTAHMLVQAYRYVHPEGRKVDCIRVTGLTKPTVYKWWDVPLSDEDKEIIQDKNIVDFMNRLDVTAILKKYIDFSDNS